MGGYWWWNWSVIHDLLYEILLIVALPGYNIELMDKYFSITSFDAVYLIDLCEPLLHVARRRFAGKGWDNVRVLCQDASEFVLPEWLDGSHPKGSVGLVTLSYSLSVVCLQLTVCNLVLLFSSPDPQLLHPPRQG
jgi:betaine lipid synthase